MEMGDSVKETRPTGEICFVSGVVSVLDFCCGVLGVGLVGGGLEGGGGLEEVEGGVEFGFNRRDVERIPGLEWCSGLVFTSTTDRLDELETDGDKDTPDDVDVVCGVGGGSG